MYQPDFLIGSYRPIYLWAGPGTIRMNKLKFMHVPVDENIHIESHQPAGADIVVNQMKQNWVHLTYSWGFPNEDEQEDWESFRQATKSYHEQKVDVFAYIQTSNCVFEGSNKIKNWYAMDPHGRKFFYYTNRFMTCLQNQEWITFLKERIKGAIDRGADGIFFDNLWYATQPTGFGESWLGSAGCYCDLCREKYRNVFGDSIPEWIDPTDPFAERYLNWRSEQLTDLFKNLASYARSLKKDVKISANDYDVVMRPSKLIHGIDFRSYADIQDLMMIENFCLPNWEPGEKIRFPNNAMTIRVAKSQLPDQKHLSVLSYDVGIGFDDVYPTRRILQGMSEITALGASVTTKGTEYFDGFEMTLITSSKYKDQQKAIGDFNQWLQKYAELFENRKNIAPVALIHPGEFLWKKWFQISPIFYGSMQTLTAAGIPWKVVADIDSIQQSKTILTFTETDQKISDSTLVKKLIHVSALEGWHLKPKSFLDKHKNICKIASWIIESLIRSYHSHPLSRKVMDKFGMAKMVTQTPLFFLPSQIKQKVLLDSITNSKYKDQQKAIGDFNQWLQKYAELFENRKNIAPVTLIHPGESLWKKWFQISPIFYGSMQTLTAAGIPWKVVADIDSIQRSRTILSFTESDQKIPDSKFVKKIIHVSELEGWHLKPKSFLDKHKKIYKFVSWIIESLIRSYHSHPFSRKVMDKFGMAKMVTQTPLFFLPSKKKQKVLLDSITNSIFPKIISNQPVLNELWQTNTGQTQIHLVNYAKTPQTIKVIFKKESAGEIHHLFNLKHDFFETTSEISFLLDIYSIILMNDPKGEL